MKITGMSKIATLKTPKGQIIKYVIRWIKAYQTELLESWKTAKKGKATSVHNLLPNTRSL